MPSFFQRKGFLLFANALCALMFGCLLTGTALLLTGQGPGAALSTLAKHPFAAGATALFFTLAGFALGMACTRLFAGLLLVDLPVTILLLVNYFKEMITSTPLELADLRLIGQAGDIAALNAQSITFTPITFLAVLIPLMWCVVVAVLQKRLALDWRWSLSGAGGGAVLFALLFVFLSNVILYTPLGVPLTTGINQSYVNTRTLTPLGLWRSVLFRDNTIRNYSAATMERVRTDIQSLTDETPDSPPSDVQPNVILILSESFFDVTRLPGVTFERDPLSEFHALQRESVSGTFQTRNLGYGTCSIELEVLTGLNNRLLPYGEDFTHYDPEQLAVFPTLPSLFADNGYYTSFLHVFNDGIYHRQDLFSALGFRDMYFIEDIPSIDPECREGENYWPYLDTKRSGYEYYSDQYLCELLIDLYEREHKTSPVFLYGVSMENHAPYTADKFSHYDYPFTTEAELSREALDTLNAYVQGVSDTSKSLKLLTDYFSRVNEPTVIVFYGDHRPGLGLEEGGSVYTQLELFTGNIASTAPAVMAELYSTDYLIWSNDPSLLQSSTTAQTDSSSNFLGLDLLKTANVALPRYWRLLDQLKNQSLIYTWSYFVDSAGKPSAALPGSVDKQRFSFMSYALHDAFHDQYLTQWLNEVP